MSTIQQLSGAAGIAIAFFSIMTATTVALMSGGKAAELAMAQGAQHSHLVAFAMVVLGLVVALMMPKTTASRNEPVHAH